MRFVADCMLGKLARWLRILGYDTFYASRAEDDDLLSLAERENRILLTRDGPMAARAGSVRCVYILHDHLDDQMAQLVADLGVDLDRRAFTRCLECNEPIEQVDRDSVRADVPSYVYTRHERFHRCPSCGRVYWAGTHLDRMAGRLAELRGSVARRGTGPPP